MVDSGVPEFGFVGEADLRAAMGAIAEAGAPLLVHAELPGPIEAASARGHAGARSARLRHLPPLAPARGRGSRHRAPRRPLPRDAAPASTSSTSRPRARSTLFRRARAEGLPLSAETTPHYLHFAAEDIPDGATAFKCAPPIRERENRERLWGALDEGLVSLDRLRSLALHAGAEAARSRRLRRAWGGIASLQLGLPVVWTDAAGAAARPSISPSG